MGSDQSGPPEPGDTRGHTGTLPGPRRPLARVLQPDGGSQASHGPPAAADPAPPPRPALRAEGGWEAPEKPRESTRKAPSLRQPYLLSAERSPGLPRPPAAQGAQRSTGPAHRGANHAPSCPPANGRAERHAPPRRPRPPRREVARVGGDTGWSGTGRGTHSPTVTVQHSAQASRLSQWAGGKGAAPKKDFQRVLVPCCKI